MLVETLLVIPFTFNLLFHTKCNKSNIVPTQAVTFNGDCCRPLLSNRHRDVHCLVFPARFRGQRSTKSLFALERRTEEKFVPLRVKHVRKQQRGRKWNGREKGWKKSKFLASPKQTQQSNTLIWKLQTEPSRTGASEWQPPRRQQPPPSGGTTTVRLLNLSRPTFSLFLELTSTVSEHLRFKKKQARQHSEVAALCCV